MRPPAPAWIVEITWITARSYLVRTRTSATTLKICHASTCIIIETVTLTCYVVLSVPVTLNVYFTTLTCAENVTLVARSPHFSLTSFTSVNLQTRNILTLFRKIASSCCVSTGITTYTVTPTCNVVLFFLVLLIDCLTMLMSAATILSCVENILVVNLSHCYHP